MLTHVTRRARSLESNQTKIMDEKFHFGFVAHLAGEFHPQVAFLRILVSGNNRVISGTAFVVRLSQYFSFPRCNVLLPRCRRYSPVDAASNNEPPFVAIIYNRDIVTHLPALTSTRPSLYRYSSLLASGRIFLGSSIRSVKVPRKNPWLSESSLPLALPSRELRSKKLKGIFCNASSRIHLLTTSIGRSSPAL